MHGWWWLVVGCVEEVPEPDLRVRVTVVKGDTLGAIAKAHGVTVAALREANGLDGDLIEVGQVLIVPEGGARPPAAVPAPRRAARRCLPPPTGEEEDMVASEGLSEAQVRQALSTVELSGCAPAGRSGRVELVVVVGCTGEVVSVEPQGAAPGDDDVVGCLVERVKGVDFPPHALPDGERFVYPLHWEG